MAPDACKISRGCNVIQILRQVIPLGVFFKKYLQRVFFQRVFFFWGYSFKLPWQSDGLATCLRIKIARSVVSGSAFGLNRILSAKAHCLARPTLNPFHPSIHSSSSIKIMIESPFFHLNMKRPSHGEALKYSVHSLSPF